MRAAFMLKNRSDQELLDGVFAAVTREFEDVAVVVAHIAEMDVRKLFAGEGCSSMKSYCMEVLRLTEDQAYSRIAVARVAQKLPVVLDMLADGLVHLTAVDRLGPSLTEENHLSILKEATHKSMAEVEEIVARLRPKSPVSSSICKLGNQGNDEGGFFSGTEDEANWEAQGVDAPPVNARKPAISPLASGSHEIRITADDEMMYALRELQELLSHQVPSGNPAVIIKHSLLRTLKDVKKERFGTGKSRKKAEATEVPKAGASVEATREATSASEVPDDGLGMPKDEAVETMKDGITRSRYIPKEIRKAVWERDGGRCAFRSERGKWCTARRFLEFHHIIPFAWRGPTTADNLELRCRTHNGYEGELLFGKIISKRDPRWHQVMAGTGSKTSGQQEARF